MVGFRWLRFPVHRLASCFGEGRGARRAYRLVRQAFNLLQTFSEEPPVHD